MSMPKVLAISRAILGVPNLGFRRFISRIIWISSDIMREYQEYVSTRPATETEVERMKLNMTRSLPGLFATNGGFLASIVASDSFGLPFDYAERRGERLAAITTDGVITRAKSVIEPNRLTWVVVGDLEQIEEKVRSLNYGEVEVWDAFGKRQR